MESGPGALGALEKGGGGSIRERKLPSWQLGVGCCECSEVTLPSTADAWSGLWHTTRSKGCPRPGGLWGSLSQSPKARDPGPPQLNL